MSAAATVAWDWVKSRLSEPSTWAGIALMATAVSTGLANKADWGTLLGGVIAAVLKEKAS